MEHSLRNTASRFYSFVFVNKRYLLLTLLWCAFLVWGPFALSQDDAANAANAGADATTKQETSYLGWLIHVSGVIGILIFALSFYFVTVVIKCFLEFRTSVIAPPEVVDETAKLIEQKKGKELVQFLQSDDSYFSEILLAGMSELRLGIEDARERLERKAELLTGKMERNISILAVIGTLGPMIGLLGTLKGMIASFSVIAISGVALDAGKVAEGISEALVLTFEGVALSIPAIFFFSYFRNQISVLSANTTMLADDQLRAVARMLPPKV